MPRRSVAWRRSDGSDAPYGPLPGLDAVVVDSHLTVTILPIQMAFPNRVFVVRTVASPIGLCHVNFLCLLSFDECRLDITAQPFD